MFLVQKHLSSPWGFSDYYTLSSRSCQTSPTGIPLCSGIYLRLCAKLHFHVSAFTVCIFFFSSLLIWANDLDYCRDTGVSETRRFLFFSTATWTTEQDSMFNPAVFIVQSLCRLFLGTQRSWSEQGESTGGTWITCGEDVACCGLYITTVLRPSVTIVPFVLCRPLDASGLWEAVGQARSLIVTLMLFFCPVNMSISTSILIANRLAGSTLYYTKGDAASLLIVNHHSFWYIQ